MKHKYIMSAFIFIFAIQSLSAQETYPVDSEVVAKIREEGFQRSQIANTLSYMTCLLYTSPSPRDRQKSRMPSSA